MVTPIARLLVVLPCHSLEDFPTYATGDEAFSLLANWTAAWHPQLIAAAKSAPTWVSQDFADTDLSSCLLFVPTSCTQLPDEFTEAINQTAHQIAGKISRGDIFAEPILKQLAPDGVQAPLAAEFFALGYAYLQIQMMTRQLRYSTTLDQNAFDQRLCDAAFAVEAGQIEQAQQKITGCFDLLLEEKNNYYPTQPGLIDLVLIPPSGDLKDQLDSQHEFNLALTGNTVEQIAARDQSASSDGTNADSDNQKNHTLEFLQSAISKEQIGFSSSQHFELYTPLVHTESIIRQINSARKLVEQHLGVRSATYCSYQHTLSPHLPAIIEQSGFTNVLHVSLTGGKLPETSSPIINWQAMDGSEIQALATRPMDASSADGLIRLGLTLGEMLDSYHQAELLFVHWPGKTCDCFEDLVVASRYGAVLGNFKTLRQMSDSMYDQGFSDRFDCEDYSAPVLYEAHQQNVANPISIWVDYWQTIMTIQAIKQLATMLAICDRQDSAWAKDSLVWQQLETSGFEADRAISRLQSNPVTIENLKRMLNELQIETIEHKGKTFSIDHLKKKIINVRQQHRSFTLKAEAHSIAGSLPPFSQQTIGNIDNRIVPADPPVVVTGTADSPPWLQNEFFSARFDSQTGGIQSVKRHAKKGNVFSQQLAMRVSQTVFKQGYPRQRSWYTQTKNVEFCCQQDGQTAGSVTSSGSLFHEDSKFADFTQTVSLQRGDRCLYFEIEIKFFRRPTGEPWRNYLANRIAWAAEDATVRRSENGFSHAVFQERFTAPNFVEIQSADAKVTILPAGLPFHRRSHRRMLDTLLSVQNESSQRFEFAISVDAATSSGAATSYQTPLFKIESGKNSTHQGWLFHLNCNNVSLLTSDPIWNENGTLSGVVMRLQETAGRSGQLEITLPFTVSAAHRTNLLHERLFDLQWEHDKVTTPFVGHQFFQLEIRFQAE